MAKTQKKAAPKAGKPRATQPAKWKPATVQKPTKHSATARVRPVKK